MFHGSTGFRQVPPPPIVTGISPSSGPETGGTSVTVTGSNFSGATAVKFGTVAATGFTVNSAVTITATAPSELPSTVDVTVTSPAGTSITGSADQFTFTTVAPTVTSVNPTTGTTAGGTVVAVVGTNFVGATAVKFGSTAAASFTVNSNTSISATSPAEAAATVDITVTNIAGTSPTGAADQFTFTAPAGATDFGPSMSADFSVNFVNLFDATTLLIGTDDGSNLSGGGIIGASFGQAGTTHPYVFTGDQVALTFSGSASVNQSAAGVVTSDQFTLAQTFNPAATNGYVLAFYTTGAVNYRVVISPSAMLSASTLTAQGRLEMRFGSVSGLAESLLVGGVTVYSDNGTAGSNQSGATTPAGTYTATTSELLWLEKIAIVP